MAFSDAFSMGFILEKKLKLMTRPYISLSVMVESLSLFDIFQLPFLLQRNNYLSTKKLSEIFTTN